MKMGPGLIWGIILIAIGLSIIFKVIFGISAFRIIIAVVFILIGVRILIGKSSWMKNNNENDVVFGERQYNIEQIINREYNTIFGKTIYDFTNLDTNTSLPADIEFNTVFGHSVIILPAQLPVKVKAEAVFGAADLPNGNTAAFSTTHYSSNLEGIGNKVLSMEANVVFGHIEIIQSKR